MVRYLPIIIVVLLTIYCVVEVAQARGQAVRVMPRWMWAVAVICAPLVGSICWLIWGRPNAASNAAVDRRPSGPDDDDEFLRRLRPRS